MQVALVIYPKFTALDIIGPFNVLADVPGLDCRLVAEHAGPVTDHTGRLTLQATHSLADTPAPEIVVVAGGMADRDITADDAVVGWLRAVHPTTTWTTSVCTGAIFMAHAGILDGLDATTHWASYDRLAALGARPTEQRVVERGKVITAAGVSAGIDMALTLVSRIMGDDVAKAVQLAIEYDPQPPFDSGSPSKADPAIKELIMAVQGF